MRCSYGRCARSAKVEVFSNGDGISRISEVRPVCFRDSAYLDGVVQKLGTTRKSWDPAKRSECLAPKGYWEEAK